MQQYVIGIDIGGTNIKAGAVDYRGNILSWRKISTEASAGWDAFVAKIIMLSDQLSSDVKDHNLVAVGFGIPGAILQKEGIVTQAPNFPALDNMPVRKMMKERLHVPCYIDNDANAIALGEMWAGAGQGSMNIVGLALGTGVGGGVIIDGELLRGADGMAAELGHIAVDANGARCNCGSTGCLETFASATGFLRMLREELGQNHDSTLKIVSGVTPAIIYEHAKAGDAVARSVIQNAGIGLGIGMASLVNIFNPEMIIVGGGLAAAWDLLMPPAIETMMKRAFKAPAARVKVTHALLEDQAGVLGSAYLAWDQIRLGDQTAKGHERKLAPWGFWEVLEEGKDYKVKRLYVHPGHRLSYQKHTQREETWMIASGRAEVVLDGKELTLNAGDTIRIAKTQAHRIGNFGDAPLVFFEVQRGTYFGEDDIVRLQDDYRR
jgi:glucokinase